MSRRWEPEEWGPAIKPRTIGGFSVTYFKTFTHDLRSPIQGGSPLWDGSVPHELPKTHLDSSSSECGAGWNYVDDLAAGFRIAGLWPDGRPSQVLVVEPVGEAVQRGDKHRSEGLTIVRYATQDEINDAVSRLSEPFGAHRERIGDSQLKWRAALSRPESNPERVEEALAEALRVRGLGDWKAERFGDARAAWDARAARDALTVEYSALQEWTKHSPDLLTAGVRDAYHHGLDIALPVGPKTLGWVMVPDSERERGKPQEVAS